MKNICFVSTTRADFGILMPLIRYFAAQSQFHTQLLVTGTHLSEHYGSSLTEIEAAGLKNVEKIPVLSEKGYNNPLSFLAQVIEKVGKRLEEIKPDLVFLLGDRFETVGIGLAAQLTKVPIAHIAGGDTTLGAYDDAFRHALSKLSHLHFPTNEPARLKLIQMGENPKHVFNFGHLGLDTIKLTTFLSKDQLQKDLNIQWGEKNILITYHPTTLDSENALAVTNFFLSLEQLPNTYHLFLTAPNADHDREMIMEKILKLKSQRRNVFVFDSLGSQKYLSMLKVVDLCLGNSSSGIYEAPFVGTPTVNVGRRQEGRLSAPSIVHCTHDISAIINAINKALPLKNQAFPSFFGDGNTSAKIFDIINRFDNFKSLLTKPFFELPGLK